ncbi:hypothetical protein Rsub_02582 [Raphidocelis subcapitata]|uniref:Uncharacterized protein n=1 Tax=Raphidocelis subcapitata TaxID=307507 RepID=A0A2V0NQE2_9CHLO|nr:hypothetical protein Rsub_02582 [Raphidocelis subcapitata]|eukprot:GBF89878.1 hypothetical protein Rsub_02582 [Raphidocelis subcapitata]
MARAPRRGGSRPALQLATSLAAALLLAAAAGPRALATPPPGDREETLVAQGGALRAADWESYAVQVPADADAPPGGGAYCRRIDAGGAIVLRAARARPAAGASLRLSLAAAPAELLPRLTLAAADGGGGKGGGAGAGVPLSKLLGGGGGGEAAVEARVADLAGGLTKFDRVVLSRPDDGGEGILVACVRALTIAYGG